MEKGEIDAVLAELWSCKLPSLRNATMLLEKTVDILGQEPTTLSLRTPITVCGDIHGQFYDLLELFSVGGKPPEQNFIFLGDYVDRGFYSTETFLLLAALKCRYPTKMFLLRGNHESRQVTEDYGFYDEVCRKYDNSVYELFLRAFNMLPLAAVIDNAIFCVHGGLSPDLNQVADIDALDRKVEPPENGLFSDLLWSDPENVTGFKQSQRGAGYVFGGDVTAKFLNQNKLKFMCRAHQQAMDGFEKWFDGLLYTVWSAPNYCYRGGNLASVFEVTTPEKTKFKIFREAPACARGKIPESKLPQYFV